MNLPDIQKEAIENYLVRFCTKKKLSDGSSSEYIHLKGTALDTDFQDFVSGIVKSSILAAFEAVEIGSRKAIKGQVSPEDYENGLGFNEANAQRREKQKEFLDAT